MERQALGARNKPYSAIFLGFLKGGMMDRHALAARTEPYRAILLDFHYL